ncbi:zinc finger protein [Cinnamomum micranthum f. kanehirae]|uniref:RING-type E3 ubiquitin transferase n=1 Tax=Cinnamomum micranthum f. kanehirae TaxID=337451 RepID=A0A443NZY5_9MAGN|nr:zinc finger protein [Cinnamomum micranthum f. kanehirae]
MMVLVSHYADDNFTAGYCDLCDSPPPPIPQKIQPSHILSLKLIIIIAIISATVLLSSYAFILKFCANRIMLRRAAPQINITPDEDDDDDDDSENQAPIHHVWYITTVGLEESVINSITVCKYKRDEGLIEGNDCSVCLSEFLDGEDVRLLPKCSHAFHLPCIDTWLRSHVNCPMCRAGVVSNSSSSSPANPNPDTLDVVDETQMGDSEIDVTLERNHSCRIERDQREEEAELDADGPVVDIETGEETSSPVENCGFSVHGDLLDNQPSRKHAIEMSENQIEPIRRSVSMDSLSASLMRITLNDHFPIDLEGSSSTAAATTRSIRNEKSNPLELLMVKKATPNRNQGILKMLSVCSKGAFLPRNVLMKRSFSAGCKFLVPRHGKG